MNHQPTGVYACPICGKPRGGRVGSGKHDKCYKILQKQMAEKNAKNEPKRRAKAEYTRKGYLAGKLPGVFE